MFPDGRAQIWEEKLGLRQKFSGNAATDWGTVSEDPALQMYTTLTGHDVRLLPFSSGSGLKG